MEDERPVDRDECRLGYIGENGTCEFLNTIMRIIPVSEVGLQGAQPDPAISVRISSAATQLGAALVSRLSRSAAWLASIPTARLASAAGIDVIGPDRMSAHEQREEQDSRDEMEEELPAPARSSSLHDRPDHAQAYRAAWIG